ncbi:MAG: radical SAM protein [Roseburia sp.]|nr:radical SAM protein [Roseburia sp.]
MGAQGCRLCPRGCNADRANGKTGFCGVTDKIQVARAALHMWEEPCISGEHGSGTVFFSGCPLQCVFCQNRSLAHNEKGRALTQEALARVFLLLQEQGAENINLVTPTHYVPQLAAALEEAKRQGLSLPIVYNTSSYETVETLRRLDGLVDIYLPDLKFRSAERAARYAKAPDYFATASAAIAEMVRQTGAPVFAGGLLRRGVIVRHLVMPAGVNEAKAVIEYLYRTYGGRIYISIMNQYTPFGDLTAFPEINRRLTPREYGRVVDYAIEIGVENAFIQEGETAGESFIPDFDEGGFLDRLQLR